MNTRFVYLTTTFLGSLLCSSALYAVNDPNAPIMQLRHPDHGGCMEAGNIIDNCVVAGTLGLGGIQFNQLSSANPLLVEVGPGTFGQIFSGGGSDRNITVRGSGVDTTTFQSLTIKLNSPNTSFADLTVGGAGVSYAVVVLGDAMGSTTTWTNTKLVGSWSEYCAIPPDNLPAGRHSFFSSQIQMTGADTYQVGCDESWFYGSDITSQGDLTKNKVTPFTVGRSELHVYGSIIRVLGTGVGATSTLLPMTAILAYAGKTHIHGTGIDVIAVDGAPASVTALLAYDGAVIHASESSFNLSTGVGGTVTRIDNQGGTIRSPYIWASLPLSGQDFSSETGADMTTVTDTADGQPHLVIYSDNCASKWYDIVDKACRP